MQIQATRCSSAHRQNTGSICEFSSAIHRIHRSEAASRGSTCLPWDCCRWAILQLTLVVFIAVAGVIGNARLHLVLKELSGRHDVARNVLAAWLAGNLLLGSQICWVLRPFIWDPNRSVVFFSPDYLNGSLYEIVFNALMRLLF